MLPLGISIPDLVIDPDFEPSNGAGGGENSYEEGQLMLLPPEDKNTWTERDLGNKTVYLSDNTEQAIRDTLEATTRHLFAEPNMGGGSLLDDEEDDEDNNAETSATKLALLAGHDLRTEKGVEERLFMLMHGLSEVSP